MTKEKTESPGGYRDNAAPVVLQAVIMDGQGGEWGRIIIPPKEFSTGSVGFYGTGKLLNPANPSARYQVGLTLTLIGSKGN
jgi:hypothetical protein